MKIMLVNHLLDSAIGGGTAERTYQLARFMTQLGVECTVLTLDIGLGSKRREALRFANLEVVACLNPRYFLPKLTMRRARALVKKCDIVLLSGHWTILNVLVARACQQLQLPYMFAPAGALVPFGRSIGLKRIYDAMVGKTLVRNAACWIAVTEAERADFMRYGIDDQQVVVIPNGINPVDYRINSLDAEASRSVAKSSGAPYVLFLGRLNLIKGPDLLIDAFSLLAAKHPGVHLILAGPDDGMQASLLQRAEERGLRDRIHFPGFLEGPIKAGILREATLLVIPSRREAMSIVVLEGGICGCPVLFTDACGLEVLALRQAGTMTSVSVVDLAEAMDRLLADPGLCRSQAERLHRIVLNEYTWAAQAQRLIDCARQVLAAPANEQQRNFA